MAKKSPYSIKIHSPDGTRNCPLNERQIKYAQLVVANPSKSQKWCAIEAGYPASGVASATQNKRVKEYINHLQLIQFENSHASVDELVAFLTTIKRNNIVKIYEVIKVGNTKKLVIKPPTEWPEELQECVKKVRFDKQGNILEVEFESKLKAAELLMRTFGMFNETIVINNHNITPEELSDDDLWGIITKRNIDKAPGTKQYNEAEEAEFENIEDPEEGDLNED